MKKKSLTIICIAVLSHSLQANDDQDIDSIVVAVRFHKKTSNYQASIPRIDEQITDEGHLFKRLQRATHMLKLMDKSGQLIIPSDIQCQENSVRWSETTFYTMQMIMCIDHLCMYKTIEPLLYTWSALIFSKAHNRPAIVQEFTKALLVLIYASLQHHFSLSSDAVLIRSSYDIKTLDTLSLEELLAILDLLVDEIPDFLEKLELNNQQLTWQEWAKKYWLVAPLTAAMVGIKVYLSYLTTHNVPKAGG